MFLEIEINCKPIRQIKLHCFVCLIRSHLFVIMFKIRIHGYHMCSSRRSSHLESIECAHSASLSVNRRFNRLFWFQFIFNFLHHKNLIVLNLVPFNSEIRLLFPFFSSPHFLLAEKTFRESHLVFFTHSILFQHRNGHWKIVKIKNFATNLQI